MHFSLPGTQVSPNWDTLIYFLCLGFSRLGFTIQWEFELETHVTASLYLQIPRKDHHYHFKFLLLLLLIILFTWSCGRNRFPSKLFCQLVCFPIQPFPEEWAPLKVQALCELQVHPSTLYKPWRPRLPVQPLRALLKDQHKYFSLAGHMVSDATTQLCRCSTNAAIDYT